MVLCLWNSSTSLGVVILDTEATVFMFIFVQVVEDRRRVAVFVLPKSRRKIQF